VLKENVEKVRGEEAANREAREKENDPGAGQWGTLTVLDRDSRAILPLVGQVPATQQAEEQSPAQSISVSMIAK
jgi:hypothetical protein